MTSARRPVLIRTNALLEVFNHRSAPSKVVTPPRLAGATARLLARGGCDWRGPPGEVDALIAEGIRRKRLARHPRYVTLEASVDAVSAAAENDDAGGLR